MDFRKRKEKVRLNRVVNFYALQTFETYLREYNISDKEIQNHLSNIDLFINDYLLRGEVLSCHNGIHTVGEYLTDWLTENFYGVTKEDIESYVESFIKFYTFNVNKGYLEKDDMIELYQIINDEVRPWLAKFPGQNQERT